MASSTPLQTNISLHPDALYCLKRKQLISLCKRFDIKASGKNSELIDRLQAFAAENPSPGSPTKGPLAFFSPTNLPNSNYYHDHTDDEMEHVPNADQQVEPEPPTSSLRRSPRKRNFQSLSEAPQSMSLKRTTRLPSSSAKPIAMKPMMLPTKQDDQVQGVDQCIADLSQNIDEMLQGIRQTNPSPDPQGKAAVDDSKGYKGEPPNPLSVPLTEFGTATLPSKSEPSQQQPNYNGPWTPFNQKIQTKSSSSSPWKMFSGSLKGWKNGLQRMGSLSRSSPSKAVGQKRHRDLQDVGSKHDDTPIQPEPLETLKADTSMPGAFVVSDEEPTDPPQTLTQTQMEEKPQPSASGRTLPLRIIKPRPSRARKSLGDIDRTLSSGSVLPLSSSSLYPDLSKIGSPSAPLIASTGIDTPTAIATPTPTATAAAAAGNGSDMVNPSRVPFATAPIPSLTSAPSITSQQFSVAAASVLAEMNARLTAAGKSTASLSTLSGTNPWSSTSSLKDLGLSKSKSSRYDNRHDKQFEKMDSIANHYAVKRGTTMVTKSSDSKGSLSNRAQSVSNSNGKTPTTAISTTPSVKRLKVSSDIATPALTSSSSSSSNGRATVATSRNGMTTTTTTMNSNPSSASLNRELQRKRLELARRERWSKNGGGPSGASLAASKVAAERAKERSRLEKLKSGIKGMLNGGTLSSPGPTTPTTSSLSSSSTNGTSDITGSPKKKTEVKSVGNHHYHHPAALSTTTKGNSSGLTATSTAVLGKRKPGLDGKPIPSPLKNSTRQNGTVTMTHRVKNQVSSSCLSSTLTKKQQQQTNALSSASKIDESKMSTTATLTVKTRPVIKKSQSTSHLTSQPNSSIRRPRIQPLQSKKLSSLEYSPSKPTPCSLSPTKRSSRNSSNTVSGSSPMVQNTLTRAEAMRKARLHQLRARQVAQQAGIGICLAPTPSTPPTKTTVCLKKDSTSSSSVPTRSSSLRNIASMTGATSPFKRVAAVHTGRGIASPRCSPSKVSVPL